MKVLITFHLTGKRLKIATVNFLFYTVTAVAAQQFGYGMTDFVEDAFISSTKNWQTHSSSVVFMALYGALNFYSYLLVYIYSPAQKPIFGKRTVTGISDYFQEFYFLNFLCSNQPLLLSRPFTFRFRLHNFITRDKKNWKIKTTKQTYRARIFHLNFILHLFEILLFHWYSGWNTRIKTIFEHKRHEKYILLMLRRFNSSVFPQGRYKII